MSARTYGMLMRVMAFALAAFIAVSIVLELPVYLPLIGVMAALVIASISRRSVKEIMSDERNRRIDEKATAFSYRLYSGVTALFALIVLLLRSGLPAWASIAGQTLAYSLCGLMLVHLAISKYYERKL